jgi:hypothetical protein
MAGATAELRAVFNNTGDIPATFTAYLTVDGIRTSVKKGPLVISPGENRTVVLDWKADGRGHEFNLSLDGADAVIFGTVIYSKGSPDVCAVAMAILPVVGFALAVPLIVALIGRRGGGTR